MTSGYKRRAALAPDVRPDINVTPLVDVVLVLLIIFMVVAPKLDQDITVELPSIFNADPDVKTAEPFKVSVPAAGEYYLNDQKYDLDRVIDLLSAEHAVDPMRRLVVRADSRLKYKDVRQLLARAQGIGFPGTSFMVNERHRTGGPAMAEAVAPAAEPPAAQE